MLILKNALIPCRQCCDQHPCYALKSRSYMPYVSGVPKMHHIFLPHSQDQAGHKEFKGNENLYSFYINFNVAIFLILARLRDTGKLCWTQDLPKLIQCTQNIACEGVNCHLGYRVLSSNKNVSRYPFR